jgi:catechol 2,3-dioxygenase-like lactoylglutathione lyase family enzyme
MSQFRGVVCVGVSNIEAAAIWYKEKLGLRESGQEVVDGEPGDMELISGNGKIVVDIVGLGGVSADTQMFYTGNAAKAREWLLSRGVNVGPLQTDGQGTRYIEFRDLEDNMIEICEEP